MQVRNFDKYFTEVCSYESNWLEPSTGLDNGLAPNRRQAIIWTNTDPIHWRKYVELVGDELTGIYGSQSRGVIFSTS